MTSSRNSISALPRGHAFAPARFTLTRDAVASYLRAVGDTTAYGDAAPPLAAVALGLQALQEQLSLPEGALHTGQEVEHHGVVPIDAALTLSGSVAQRSERQGFVISVLEFSILSDDATLISARTTIMAPAGGA